VTDHDPGNDDELYQELLQRGEIVVDLDAAQLAAWASGLFAALDDDAAVLGFIEHASSNQTPAAAAVLAAIGYLADGEVARAARQSSDRMASLAPESVAGLGRARSAQAWRVQARFGSSLVIGFRQDPDVVDHALLVEIEDGVLTDLQMSGPPNELLDPDVVGEGVDVVTIEAGEALQEVVAAWEQAAQAGVEVTPGIAANQHLVRRRLGEELGADLPLLELHDAAVDLSRGMSTDEIARANEAALGTLRAAVGDPASSETGSGQAQSGWIEVVRGTVPGLSPREQEGLLWLEWADWLGVGIGLLRGGAEHPITAGSFVDLINRCPEISSTVHADDRDYAEWAFDVAIEHLQDNGLVEGESLTGTGWSSLHVSLLAAWS
jgi:hypothetical protein